ncbi:hypothetical protein [Kribbella sp. C-35]|uniref:hypothetical protein n=1 Tax=Kribbella sp. C-35 TaxID=2789276 RepID=UPI0039789CD7
MSGADLLGTMLDRHSGDVEQALAEWERILRPNLDVFQRNGIQQRTFFVPATASELALRKVMTTGLRMPVFTSLLRQLRSRDKAGRLKDHDIALA